jgi:hypothetical protein
MTNKAFHASAFICSSCQQPKTKNVFHCGVCQKIVCKSCIQFLEESSFSFLKKVPEELSKAFYCVACYDQHVAPAMAHYLEVMEHAKEVYIFFKKDKDISQLKRSNVPLSVINCPDRDETILRLAFLAAELSCNAVVEVDVVSEKIRNHGYQTSSWSGKGFPAHVRIEDLPFHVS